MRDGMLDGLQTAVGPITTRIVVDASGQTRWLGRALEVASPARSMRLIARYGYMEGSCPLYDDAPSLVGDESGWTWTALVRPKLYQMGATFIRRPASLRLDAATPTRPDAPRAQPWSGRDLADDEQGGRSRMVHGRRRRGIA